MSTPDLLGRLREVERLLKLLLAKMDVPPAISANDLSESRAKSVLQADLFNREQAANYTRRSPKTFDNTLRPDLNNYGTEAGPLYSKREIDQWLNLIPGPSDASGEALTTTSASLTTESVTKSQLAREILLRLRASRNDSTGKS